VVIMKSAHYEWLPDPGRRGVQVKTLGSFTEYQTTVALLRLAAGSRLDGQTLAAPQLRYVLSGAVEYGGQVYQPGSCFWLPAGASSLPLDSTAGAELYAVTIPRYASDPSLTHAEGATCRSSAQAD
jgi:hypothetical protein